MENLVNPNLAVMPLWMWVIFMYGLLSLVSRFTNFLCRDNKKHKNKRV